MTPFTLVLLKLGKKSLDTFIDIKLFIYSFFLSISFKNIKLNFIKSYLMFYEVYFSVFLKTFSYNISHIQQQQYHKQTTTIL